ncbi:MAG TPA: hypothetical protein VLA52_00050 [Thermohalobaculum sp.]|nr:hypothetical protein [Thermohalobaculum sp.]
MSTDVRILTLGLDGLWMPMDLARLTHLVVRYYRLEQLVQMAETGASNLFDHRLDAVALKYLAAFDWIAAPLMSGRYNQTYAQSEDFVRRFGMHDILIDTIRYDAYGEGNADGVKAEGGHIAFRGRGAIIERLYKVCRDIYDLHRHGSPVEDDSQGKYLALEIMYKANMKAKAGLMREAEYSDAELNAIVSPSIEDLHFLSNAMRQGRIVSVGRRKA